MTEGISQSGLEIKLNPSKEDSKNPAKSIKKGKTMSWLTIVSFLLFISLFIFGINANEPQRVLEQAWNICLDCIGIG